MVGHNIELINDGINKIEKSVGRVPDIALRLQDCLQDLLLFYQQLIIKD